MMQKERFVLYGQKYGINWRWLKETEIVDIERYTFNLIHQEERLSDILE